MSMETLYSDFSNGRLSNEEYERNGISFEENKEIELEKDYIEEKIVNPTEIEFKIHLRVKSEKGFFEEDRIVKAENRRKAELIIERELDKTGWEYTYTIK